MSLNTGETSSSTIHYRDVFKEAARRVPFAWNTQGKMGHAHIFRPRAMYARAVKVINNDLMSPNNGHHGWLGSTSGGPATTRHPSFIRTGYLHAFPGCNNAALGTFYDLQRTFFS